MIPSQYVSELLLRHNCLIIPGFGGFVARYAPAKIDWNRGVIAPPSKELLFNSHLIQSDGLFANYLANARNISFEEAEQLLKELASDWKGQLSEGKRIEIEKVGILYKETSGVIAFEQDRFFNLLLSSFGLKEVTFISEKEEKVAEQPILTKVEPQEAVESPEKVVAEEAKELKVIPIGISVRKGNPVEEAPSEGEKIIPIREQKTKSGFGWKYLAAAAMVPFGFFAYWIPMKTDVLESGKIALADFNPFRTVPESVYSAEKLSDAVVAEELHYDWEELTKDLPREIEVFNYRFNENLYIPVRLIADEKTASTEQTETVVVSPQYSGNYHLIAGCFSSLENAENLVTDLKNKGYAARILDVNKGLHRVTIASFENQSAAATEMNTFSSQGISTWVLKK